MDCERRLPCTGFASAFSLRPLRLCARFFLMGLPGKSLKKNRAETQRAQRRRILGECGTESLRGSEPTHRHTSYQSKAYLSLSRHNCRHNPAHEISVYEAKLTHSQFLRYKRRHAKAAADWKCYSRIIDRMS
jgi:hypothetical protein